MSSDAFGTAQKQHPLRAAQGNRCRFGSLAAVGVLRLMGGVQVVRAWTGQPMFSWGLIAAGSHSEQSRENEIRFPECLICESRDSCDTIAERLNAEGIPARAEKWHATSVSRALKANS
jgi:hypothetical protein